jgi:exonuclease SbcD
MPLRILHTADWHVGRTVARRSRIGEHRAVLAEIAEIAATRQVDVVLVAGDLFDRQNPSPDAERVVYDALADLRRAAPRVVVVAGNHDSPRRWEALAPIATGLDIVARLDNDLTRHILDIDGADGTRARLACLPWIPERHFLRAEHVSGDTPHPFADGMAALVAELVGLAGQGGLPVVLAAHLNAAGALMGGGERPRAVAGDTAVSPASLGGGLAYGALGHIHRPQRVGTAPVYYSGSVLSLDFSERDDAKGVVVAEVGDGDTRVEIVPLTRGTPLHRIEATLDELEDAALRGDLPRGHVQVNLTCAGPQAGLGDRVRELVDGCVDVRLVYPPPTPTERPASLRDLSLREMFAQYLTERAGFAAVDPELLRAFQELVEESDDDQADAAGLIEDAA